jgi:hypothetical protein
MGLSHLGSPHMGLSHLGLSHLGLPQFLKKNWHPKVSKPIWLQDLIPDMRHLYVERDGQGLLNNN